MDVEYADDEIGSLEDEDVATRGTSYGQGDARVQDALDDFLKNYRKGNRVVRSVEGWSVHSTARSCAFEYTL